MKKFMLLLLAAFGFSAFSMAADVAQIVGGATYSSLQDAIDAASNGDRIEVLVVSVWTGENSIPGATIPAGKSLTLDTKQVYIAGTITVQGTVTITSTLNGASNNTQATIEKVKVEGDGYVEIVTGGTIMELEGVTTENCVIKGSYFMGVNPTPYVATGYKAETVGRGWQVVVAPNAGEGGGGETAPDTPVVEYVAQIGDVGYESLWQAVRAVQDGETITLLKDYVDDSLNKIESTKRYTIDFNGYSFTKNCTGATKAVQVIVVSPNGNLTLKNSNAEKKSYLITDAESAAIIQNEGTLTIEGDITIQSICENNYTPDGILNFDENCTLTINGATITGTDDGIASSGGKVSLTNVTIDAYTGLRLSGATTATIDGCSVTAYTGQNAISLSSSATATITSGTYDGGLNGTGGQLSISGGTFSANPTPYLAEGYQAVPNDETNPTQWTVVEATPVVATVNGAQYETLEEAIKVVDEGQTVTLLQDVVLAEPLSLDKDFTLDLGGKTLSTQVSATSGVHTLKVDNGTITLKNGTVKGNTPGTTTHSAGAAVLVSGACTLNLEGVTLVGGDSVDAGMGSALQFNNQASGASVTINNSTLMGGTTTPSGETVVGGGGNAIEMHADVASSISITMSGENTLWASTYASPYGTDTACVVYNSGNASSDAHALVSIAVVGIINVTGGLLYNVDISTTSEVVIKAVESGAISDNMDYVVNGKNAYALTDEGATVTVGALTAETAEAEINGTYYRSFIGAVNAATEGDTITLHKDVIVTSSYTLKKGVTVAGKYTVSGIAASVENTRYSTTTYYTTFTEAAAALGPYYATTLVMLANYEATGNIAIGDISGAGVVTIDTNEQTLTIGDNIFYSGSVGENKAPIQVYDSGTKCWYIAGESKLPDVFTKNLTGPVSVKLNGNAYLTASAKLTGTNVTLDLNGYELSNASTGSFAMSYPAALPLFAVGESSLAVIDSVGTGKVALYEGAIFSGGVKPMTNPSLDNCFTVTEGVGSVSIEGGSYPVDPTKYLAEGLGAEQDPTTGQWGVAEKKVCEINGTGYTSLQAALDAATDGQTIKLLQDVTLDVVPTLEGGKVVTIDANEYTLTAPRAMIDSASFRYTNGFGWRTYYASQGANFILFPDFDATQEQCVKSQPSQVYIFDDWTIPYDFELGCGNRHTTSGFLVKEGYEVTINLAGHTIRQNNCSGDGMSFFTNRGKLTIIDEPTEDCETIGTVIAGVSDGWVTLKDGSKRYGYGGVALTMYDNGETIISGGVWTDAAPTKADVIGQISNNGTINVYNNGKVIVDGATIIPDDSNYAFVIRGGTVDLQSGSIEWGDANPVYSAYAMGGMSTVGENFSAKGTFYATAGTVNVNAPMTQVGGAGTFVPGEGLIKVGGWVIKDIPAEEVICMIDFAGEDSDMYFDSLDSAIGVANHSGWSITLCKDLTLTAVPENNNYPVTIYPEGSSFTAPEMIQESSTILLPSTYAWDKGAEEGTVTAVAAVAKIGNKGYATLQAALDAATVNDTIQLLADIDLDATVTIENKNLIIDGAKDDGTCYTVTGKGITKLTGGKINGFVIKGGTVTMKNMVLTDYDEVLTCNSGSVVSVEGGAIFSASKLTIDKFARDAFRIRASSFTVEDCYINCSPDVQRVNPALTKGFQIGILDTLTSGTIKNTTITYAGSTYEDWSACAVEIYAKSDVVIDGCTINNCEYGIGVDNYWVGHGYGTGAANVTLTGDTVIEATYPVKIDYREGQAATDTASVSIESGTYTGATGYVFNLSSGYVEPAETGITATYSISGGTYSQVLPLEACAPTFGGVYNEETQMYEVVQVVAAVVTDTDIRCYKTLNEALDWAQLGNTVYVLDNTTEVVTEPVRDGVILSAEGEWTIAGPVSGGAYAIATTASLTVTGGIDATRLTFLGALPAAEADGSYRVPVEAEITATTVVHSESGKTARTVTAKSATDATGGTLLTFSAVTGPVTIQTKLDETLQPIIDVETEQEVKVPVLDITQVVSTSGTYTRPDSDIPVVQTQVKTKDTESGTETFTTLTVLDPTVLLDGDGTSSLTTMAGTKPVEESEVEEVMYLLGLELKVTADGVEGAYEFGITRLALVNGHIEPVITLMEDGEAVIDRTLNERTLIAEAVELDETGAVTKMLETLYMDNPVFDSTTGRCQVKDTASGVGFNVADFTEGRGTSIRIKVMKRSDVVKPAMP